MAADSYISTDVQTQQRTNKTLGKEEQIENDKKAMTHKKGEKKGGNEEKII